jgi:hypothetical protein
MSYQTTTKAGVGIGAFGVVFTFLTTAFLILIPQHFMAPAARAAYIGTWSSPIMALGEAVMVYGLPLLSIAVAYYLTTRNHSPKSVLAGFFVGGLVLGLGETFLGVTLIYFFVENPAVGQSLISHVSDILGLGSRLVGGAVIGILCARAVEKYY